MFDKLIESEPEGANFRNRSKFFITSSLVVGVLFLAAVVISIFAADYSLRSGDLDIAELLAPVDVAAPDPEPPTPQPQKQSPQVSKDQTPTRQVNMVRLDEEPFAVPDKPSVTPNTQLARPLDGFKLGPVDSDPPGGTSSRGTDPNPSAPSGIGNNTVSEATPAGPPAPPPPVKVEPVKPKIPPVVSRGVVNGQATYLPKPVYSAAAQAVGAQGTVQVQILIDESGKVVSAKAVSGNMLLRQSAETAALNAKFLPTKLSDVPVKVTGIITYNFMRG
ncbi:MAG: TonB family protein [Acidobacteria bacterium]|nr:TonB family protein [Acidobacteriota bacterium]